MAGAPVTFGEQPDAIGAPGRQVLRFEALDEGRTNLELVYHRPWEDAGPDEVFSVEGVVH
jgi:predicted secreted protein